MKFYQSIPQVLDAGQSLTIEAHADSEGTLDVPLSDRDLQRGLQQLQHANVDKAFWQHAPDCTELGMYTVRFMSRTAEDGYQMFNVKVWVVPAS